MELTQPTVTITIQIATKTDKVDSDGESLYKCGSPYHLYRESDLIECFKNMQPNVEIFHDVNRIWGFYEISEDQVEIAMQGDELVSFSFVEHMKRRPK